MSSSICLLPSAGQGEAHAAVALQQGVGSPQEPDGPTSQAACCPGGEALGETMSRPSCSSLAQQSQAHSHPSCYLGQVHAVAEQRPPLGHDSCSRPSSELQRALFCTTEKTANLAAHACASGVQRCPLKAINARSRLHQPATVLVYAGER